MKTCAHCGKSMQGIRNRKFCSRICMAEAFTKQPETADAGRYQAQHFYQANTCEKCGVTGKRIHRHHKDSNPTNNAPENIAILCAKCHSQEHKRMIQTSICAVCGKKFIAASHRNRNKICSAECAKQWGRINANKRWQAGSENCAPTGTR